MLCCDVQGQQYSVAHQAIFVDRPTKRASVAQGLFKGGSRGRAGAQTRPAFLEMLQAPSAFPWRERLRRQAVTPPRRGLRREYTAPWGSRKLTIMFLHMYNVCDWYGFITYLSVCLCDVCSMSMYACGTI